MEQIQKIIDTQDKVISLLNVLGEILSNEGDFVETIGNLHFNSLLVLNHLHALNDEMEVIKNHLRRLG